MSSDVSPAPVTPAQQAIKRCVDILIAFFGLVILSPLLLFIAIRVWLSSKGPVIYSQERLGRNGKVFLIHKFRSMVDGAEREGPQLSYSQDPRVTTWGHTMRRHKLDELPQLWNVLLGEMSIVGPRPERPFYYHQLQQFVNAAALLQLRPGLTSLGMVQFGYAGSVAEMVERTKYDLQYLSKYSFRLDLSIMLKTVRIIFQGKNR